MTVDLDYCVNQLVEQKRAFFVVVVYVSMIDNEMLCYAASIWMDIIPQLLCTHGPLLSFEL